MPLGTGPGGRWSRSEPFTGEAATGTRRPTRHLAAAQPGVFSAATGRTKHTPSQLFAIAPATSWDGLVPDLDFDYRLGSMSPLDRARRQARRVLTEQIPERRTGVPSREPAQAQDRQHLDHPRRPTILRRQDPRAEPLALSRLIVNAPVVHPRRLDRDRPRADRQPPPHARPLRTTSRSRPRRAHSRTTDVLVTPASSEVAIVRRAPSRADDRA